MEPAVAADRVRRPRRLDVLLAAVVVVIAQLESWLTTAYDPKAAYAAAALAMGVVLAWRRVAPLTVVGLVFVPLLVMALAGRRIESAYVMLVLLVAFAAVGAYCERRRAVAGLGIGLTLLAGVMLCEHLVDSPNAEPPVAGDFVFLAAILGMVWTLGVALRERSQRAGELQERADRLEREQEQQARAAVAEERARIARELHDVVAHSVSVIAVQTGSIRHRLRTDRPAEAAELSGVEQTARQALAEMRRMLGLLRADDEGLSLTPQPGMDEVQRLVDHMRETGLPVELAVEGDRRPLAPGVDLAAYRILQEALTNVLKHAGPAHARVAVRFGERSLDLEVADDGRGLDSEHNGGGHGLVGMRERVALYGGSLETRPGSDGGFVVKASLPIP
ncbi:MAG: sensor histidine kinase [Solirubrobacteraceae bacterium]|nr:sensor histidine kinase [Solirubrobacteraceae bacterium]